MKKCFEDLAREIYTDVAFEAYEQEQANNLASKEEEGSDIPVFL